MVRVSFHLSRFPSPSYCSSHCSSHCSFSFHPRFVYSQCPSEDDSLSAFRHSCETAIVWVLFLLLLLPIDTIFRHPSRLGPPYRDSVLRLQFYALTLSCKYFDPLGSYYLSSINPCERIYQQSSLPTPSRAIRCKSKLSKHFFPPSLFFL